MAIHTASAFMTSNSVTAPQAAMTRTKKLCAVIVDTLGREVMVRRPCVFGPDGWPAHPGDTAATAPCRVLTASQRDPHSS